VKPGAQFFDAVEIYDARAIDSEKLRRVQFPLQSVYSAADLIRLISNMQSDVVAGGLDPIDALDRNEKGAVARSYQQSAGEFLPRLHFVEESLEAVIECSVNRADIDLDIPPCVINCPLEPSPIEWL